MADSSSCGDASPTLGSWSGLANPGGSILLSAPDNPGYVLSDGDTYGLGLPFANPPGVSFQVCWAFDPTANGGASDYKVLVGSFSMYGPQQDVQLACILGQPCNLKLRGLALAPTNSILIVSGESVCGHAQQTAAMLQGITNPRLVTDDPYDDKYSFGMVTVGGSYAACRVASPASTCIGSNYKLCWSHGLSQSPLTGQPNFIVEIGTFAMGGPLVTYSVGCSLGSICAFRIYGSEFRTSNKVLIVEATANCGDEYPIIASFDGLQNPSHALEVTQGGNEATYRLGRSHSGQLGSYRLCWGFNPIVPRHYNIEVGSFTFSQQPEGCLTEGGLLISCPAGHV